MPSISSPFDLLIVLVALGGCTAAALFERNHESGVLTLSAFFAVLVAVLWIWQTTPLLVLLGALTFCVAAVIVRPKGAARCWAFGFAFLIMANAMPIAVSMPSLVMAVTVVVALTGLSISIGPGRLGNVIGALFAAVWSFGVIGMIS